jgi:hypothetical protein
MAFAHPQDPGGAEPLSDVLRRQGYHVAFAATVRAAEALVALRGRAPPALITAAVPPGRQDPPGARGAAHAPRILLGDGPTPGGPAPPGARWLAPPLAPEPLPAAVRDTLRGEDAGRRPGHHRGPT